MKTVTTLGTMMMLMRMGGCTSKLMSVNTREMMLASDLDLNLIRSHSMKDCT